MSKNSKLHSLFIDRNFISYKKYCHDRILDKECEENFFDKISNESNFVTIKFFAFKHFENSLRNAIILGE